MPCDRRFTSGRSHPGVSLNWKARIFSIGVDVPRGVFLYVLFHDADATQERRRMSVVGERRALKAMFPNGATFLMETRVCSCQPLACE
jgi:hypothetical protein